MAKPTQYTFALDEVAKLMIKEAGLHEGRWTLGIEFGIAVGAMGQGPDKDAFPGALVTANKLRLSVVSDSSAEPPNLVFDAAKINPK